MAVEARGQVNQIGEDIGRVGEEEQPRAGQAEEPPVPARGALVPLTGQQREEHRQPRQEQIPNEECSNESLPVQTIRAATSATLTAEAKVNASIGMAVSRLKASFNSII